MVNGKWQAFISRFYPKHVTVDASHSHTRTRTPAATGYPARYQSARAVGFLVS